MSEERTENSEPTTGTERFRSYTLLDALIGRRSRRFAPGMKLNGGPSHIRVRACHSLYPLTKKPRSHLPPAG